MYKKLIDKIIWWIPFKNLRNFIRDILINISEISKIREELNNIKYRKDNIMGLSLFCNTSNKMLDNNIYEYDFIFNEDIIKYKLEKS